MAAVPLVTFTANLQRHVQSPPGQTSGATVREALEEVFGKSPLLRTYVLDDQGRVRKHMSIFVDGQQIADREGLSDPVRPDSEIYVLQALSGGCAKVRGTSSEG
jgi:sulfur-carrier protein